jgi:hypothetical protein
MFGFRAQVRLVSLAFYPRLFHVADAQLPQAFWFPDVTLLLCYFGGFTILSYLSLVLFVRERR